MSDNKIIADYLASVEKELFALNSEQRAKSIVNLRADIEKEFSDFGPLSSRLLFEKFGSPREVALRYLDQYGVNHESPKSSSGALVGVFKWLVIFFLGLSLFGTILAIVVISQFSPILEVDDENGSVKIFGGMIDIQESETERYNINIRAPQKGDYEEYFVIDDLAVVEKIIIPTGTGNLSIENTSSSNVVSLECTSNQDKLGNLVSQAAGVISVDLKRLGAIRCELEFPRDIPIQLDMQSGVLNIEEIQNNLKVDMKSGRITISERQAQAYKYNFETLSVKTDKFVRSELPEAYVIDIKLDSGVIRKD